MGTAACMRGTGMAHVSLVSFGCLVLGQALDERRGLAMCAEQVTRHPRCAAPGMRSLDVHRQDFLNEFESMLRDATKSISIARGSEPALPGSEKTGC